MLIELIPEDFEKAIIRYTEYVSSDEGPDSSSSGCASIAPNCCPIAQALMRITGEKDFIEVCDHESISCGEYAYREVNAKETISDFINWFDKNWNKKSLSDLIGQSPYKKFEVDKLNPFTLEEEE